MFQSVKNKKESRCNSDHMKIQFYQKTFLSKYSFIIKSFIKRQFYQKDIFIKRQFLFINKVSRIM